MYVLFFDIDNTLLNTDSLTFLNHIGPTYQKLNNQNLRQQAIQQIVNNYRKNIPYNQKLSKLLQNIKYPKYIITNASRIHSLLSLKSLGINHHFLGGIDANHLNRSYLKPSIHPYILAMKMANINLKKQKCIFFDDLEPNLIIPKKLGWITILIGTVYPKSKKPPFIDFCFSDIYKALNFLHQQI